MYIDKREILMNAIIKKLKKIKKKEKRSGVYISLPCPVFANNNSGRGTELIKR